MTGYMVLQMLDAQVDGKLLPQWMKTGPIGTALEWGIQGWYMLDMGRDINVLANAMPRTAALMKAFTAPTRAVLGGITSALKGAAAATLPKAAGAAAVSGAATGAMTSMTGRAGMVGEAMAAAHAAGQAAAGASRAGAMGAAVGELGQQLGTGQATVVGAATMLNGAPNPLADYHAIMNSEGALQLVPKDAVLEGAKMVTPPLQGGAKLQTGISNGINGAFKSIAPFLKTLQVGGAIFGTIANGMQMVSVAQNQGAKSLITTRDGRSALFGFLGSATFLGMMALPLAAPALGASIGVAASAMNIASNVFSGISMLSYAGLGGEGGFLDHDAVRAAFLIPPLTPLGLAAMWLKRRETDAKKKAEAAQAQQQAAAQALQQQRQQAEAQLQAGGVPAGGQKLQDGSVLVQTGVASDLSSVGGAPESGQQAPTAQQQAAPDTGNLNRQLQLVARPMR
jgi:hypothetical protein